MAALKVRRRTHAEIRAAFERYRAESPRAADAFLRKVRDAIAAITENPQQFHVLRGRLRRVMLPHSPYAVYFKIYRHHISVVGVVHLRRDPKHWLLREVPGITVYA